MKCLKNGFKRHWLTSAASLWHKLVLFFVRQYYIRFFSIFWCTFYFAGTDIKLIREFSRLLLDIVLLPLQASMCLSQVAHAAGMQTLIFLDRGWPDPPRLTFTATHTAVSRGEPCSVADLLSSGLGCGSQWVISQLFTNRWMEYFKNMRKVSKFAIKDTKTGVISKSDLSVAAAESMHTFAWLFCLSQKVNMQLKAKLTCHVMPQVTANITTGLWLDNMSFMFRLDSFSERALATCVSHIFSYLDQRWQHLTSLDCCKTW